MCEQSSRVVTINFPNHHDQLVQGLWNFVGSKHDMNFEFCVGGRLVGAHRLVLEVFLSSETLVQSSRPDRLDAPPGGVADFVLEFLYRGRVSVPEEQLGELLVAARELNLQVLVDALKAVPKDAAATEIEDAAEKGERSKCGEDADTSPGGTSRKCLKRDCSEQIKPSRLTPRRSKRVNNVCHQSDGPAVPKVFECGTCDYSTKRSYDFRVHRARHDGTPLFKCGECGKMFFSDASLQSHSAGHRKGGRTTVFKCDLCVRWFKTAEMLERHRSTHSGGPAPETAHQCPLCDYKVKSKFGLNVHMAKHDPSIQLYRCRTCSKSFLTEESFQAHNSRLHANDLEVYECGQCDYKTASKIRYQIHLSSKHDPSSNAAALPCPSCPKVFLTADALERHRVAVHSDGPKSHQCPHCDYKSHLISRFRIHAARHDPNVAIHRCALCGTKFHTEALLERHRNRRHLTPVPTTSQPPYLQCHHCSYRTRNRQLLRLHRSKHDPSVVAGRCELCSRSFFSADALERHKRAHRVHRCPHCEFQTSKRPSFYLHLRSKHGVNVRGEQTQRRHACSECDARFFFPAELKYHTRTLHSHGFRPFKCHLCNAYSSTRKADLKQHINVSHLRIRNFLCETCGYAALSRSGLAEHIRVHTGEKPLGCQVCGRFFRARSSLRKHALLHASDARPFVCEVCGHAFNRNYNLRIHLKNVHKL